MEQKWCIWFCGRRFCSNFPQKRSSLSHSHRVTGGSKVLMEIPTSVDMGSEEYVVNLLLPLFKPHMPFRFSKTITTIHCARMELSAQNQESRPNRAHTRGKSCYTLKVSPRGERLPPFLCWFNSPPTINVGLIPTLRSTC